MTVRNDLLGLCRALGDPARDLAVLGEGNASARLDADTILVTASGSTLAGVTDEELVTVAVEPAVALARSRTDAATTVGPPELSTLVVGGSSPGRRIPSIETLLHAILLERTDALFVGHTHPTAVLGLACSDRFPEAFAGRVFPDEVVVCGPSYLLVPYASPGLALAEALDSALTHHIAAEGRTPVAVILANHGLLALGRTPAEVTAVTTMTEKSARIRSAALAVGAVRTLDPAEVDALASRTDERYRRDRLFGGPPAAAGPRVSP